MTRHTFRFLFITALFLLLSSHAYSAQVSVQNLLDPSEHSYLSTPKKVYTVNGWIYKFSVDGYAYYPNEIYLPNENNPEQYRIHTNYTKVTDACASCHATHTAVGPSLVQWYSNYETCLACHDGTVSTTYNVVEGIIPRSGQWTSGGVFGTGKEQFLSYHNVTGAVQIGAAPNSELLPGTKFEMPMGCESCHSPHGFGGNARLLSPDPNGVQFAEQEKYRNYPLIQIATDNLNNVVIFAAYPKNSDGVVDTTYQPYYMLKDYNYPLAIYNNNEQITTALIDNSLGYSRIKIPLGTAIDNITATFVPSLRVRMTVKNYLAISSTGQTVNEMVYYKDGSEAFCRACHNSYGSTQNPASDAQLDNFKHTHPVGMSVDTARVELNKDAEVYKGVLKDKFEDNETVVCITCHAPHGVDQDYWIRSVGFGSNDPSDMSFSSCLKRSPNGSLCLTCHPWDLANQGYLTNSGQEKFEPQLTTQLAVVGNQALNSNGFSNYAGSDITTCSGRCHHKPIVNGWKETNHALSLADSSGISSLALNNEGTFSKDIGITISDVVYVIGVKNFQRYIYRENGVLKVAKDQLDLKTGNWDDKPVVQDFINACAGCHVTGLDLSTGTWTDNGVACEACHGTGKNHVDVPKSRNITNPRYLYMKDQTDICAQCHALGQNETDGVKRPYPVGYAPMQDALTSAVYHDEYQLSAFYSIYGADKYPGNFFSNPNPATLGIRDSYFPAQQVNDFVQSKHYESNIMSCETCHSSHSTNWKGQLLKGTFEQVCGACHDTGYNINLVMPTRINSMGGSTKLRVHTFTKYHDESTTKGSGDSLIIH